MTQNDLVYNCVCSSECAYLLVELLKHCLPLNLDCQVRFVIEFNIQLIYEKIFIFEGIIFIAFTRSSKIVNFQEG